MSDHDTLNKGCECDNCEMEKHWNHGTTATGTKTPSTKLTIEKEWQKEVKAIGEAVKESKEYAEKEWDLSSKIDEMMVTNDWDEAILKDDVKEFIRRLKDEFGAICKSDVQGHINQGIIDKLAGEELV